MITIANYVVVNEAIEDVEVFVNELYIGLKHYEKQDPDFKFKMFQTDDTIEIKTIRLNEHVN